MLVVSNTSPLSNLAIIGQLHLVREQFHAIVIPPGVLAELNRVPDARAQQALFGAITDGWISVAPLTTPVPPELETTLDAGEAEALTLAFEVKADLVLLDETDARRKAGELRIAFTGVLGILRKARLNQRIPSLKQAIGALRTEAHFFISPALERALLISVGEN